MWPLLENFFRISPGYCIQDKARVGIYRIKGVQKNITRAKIIVALATAGNCCYQQLV